MTKIKMVHNDEELDMMLKALGGERCTIIFFFLPWCGSCQKMNPFVEAIAERNPNSLFIKVFKKIN
jgi:thiol-disulfide isomerase/thioredoxin